MSGSVNRPPATQDDLLSVRPFYDTFNLFFTFADLTRNDSDPEGGPLTLLSIAPMPGTGTGDWASLNYPSNEDIYLSVDQSISGEGVATFLYTVADEGGLTATGTVQILYGTPDPPPLELTVAEDTRIVVGTYGESPGSSPFGYNQPAHGVVYEEGVSPPEGGRPTVFIYYQPDPDFSGTDTFAFNDGLPGTQNHYPDSPVIITVTPVPDRPDAMDDSISGLAGKTLFIPVAQLLVNDSDADGDPLTISAVGGAMHGSVVLDSGSVSFTPAAGYTGQASFTYTIQDGTGLQATATVNVATGSATTGSYVRGTPGEDVLDYSGATVRVQIAGLAGNDTLRGGSANDALNGGAGRDIISGGAGNDTITGGPGADRMAGNGGSDTFIIAVGDVAMTNATDLIVDFQGAGQAGGDMIRFIGFAAGSTLALVGTSGNARVYEVQNTLGGSEGQLLVSAGGTQGQALSISDYLFL